MSEGLVEMFEYNQWANLTLAEACRHIDEAALDGRVAGVSGSVRELLMHLAGGQRAFLLRTAGRQHEGEWGRSSPWPGFDSVVRELDETGAGLIEVASSLADGAVVDLPYLGKTFRFPVRFFLVHAMEHGVEHRTEIKVALASRGIHTPGLDGWAYAAARGYGQEVNLPP